MGKPWLLHVWHHKCPVSSRLWSSLVCLPNLNLWKICSCRRSRRDYLSWWHNLSCTFLPSVLWGAGVSISSSDTTGNILSHCVPCSISFFLSFPLTLLSTHNLFFVHPPFSFLLNECCFLPASPSHWMFAFRKVNTEPNLLLPNSLLSSSRMAKAGQ